LDKVKRNYEIICKAADEARNAFEKADKDLNVTKGQVDKVNLHVKTTTYLVNKPAQ
jgi:hypothetical protein